LNFPDDLLIYDTTLRDGEQTPGVCFSPEEKLEIARKLDQFKIHQIEAGFPIVSQREKETVKTIAGEGLDADILALTRTKPEDIDAALDCDVDGIITFVGTSDIHLDHKMHITRQDAINLCETAVDYAKDHGLYVAFSAEGYVMSHRERELKEPTVSLEDAQGGLSSGLNVLSSGRAVIETAGKSEILCHEFECESEDGRRCLLYVNGETGAEEKLTLLSEEVFVS